MSVNETSEETSELDERLARELEDGERMLHAALEEAMPGEYTIHRCTEVTEDESVVIEVGDGAAALEPVMTDVRFGLGNVLHLHVLWRVFRQVDDSDASVGMFGTVLVPSEPVCEASRAAWCVQDGCYCRVSDAIKHIVHNLIDQRLDVALENEGITIALERGEM